MKLMEMRAKIDWKYINVGQFYQYQEGNEIKLLVSILQNKSNKEKYEYLLQVEDIIDGIDKDSFKVGQTLTVIKPKKGKIIGVTPEFKFMGEALD